LNFKSNTHEAQLEEPKAKKEKAQECHIETGKIAKPTNNTKGDKSSKMAKKG
jgi:hypothetical protein